MHCFSVLLLPLRLFPLLLLLLLLTFPSTSTSTSSSSPSLPHPRALPLQPRHCPDDTTQDDAEPAERISSHVTVTIHPSNVTRFFAGLKPAFDAVTKEKYNTFFEVFMNTVRVPADTVEGGVEVQFRFVENWSKSVEWFNEVQLKKDYYKPYLAITEPMWIKPRQFEFFERLEATEWVRTKL